MGNKKVWGHGLQFFLVPLHLTEGVFDPHLLLYEPSKFDWAKVNVPYSVVNLFEPNILAGAADAHIDPVTSPTDTTVVADIAGLEVRRIF